MHHHHPTKEKTLETKILPDKKIKCYGICIQHNFITYAHDKGGKKKKKERFKQKKIII